jgi:predicted nucleic acid-binding protein
VTLVLDSGVLIVQADVDDHRHEAVARLLREEPGPLVTTEMVAAEADYMIMSKLGVDIELDFLDDLAASSFIVECLSGADFGTVREVARRYRDLKLGITDASLVVLAQRHRTSRIATFDQRAFRNVAPLQGGSFTLLPQDLGDSTAR